MKPHETGTNNPIDFPKQTNKYDAHKESIKGKTLTANELADAMDTKGFRYREVKAAVKMLRQFGLAESIIKQQQLEIEALKNNLDFIVGINRLGLGVQKEGGLSSEKIEKIWLSIEEQRDDNFHYGWKKCEQYYGIRKAQEK